MKYSVKSGGTNENIMEVARALRREMTPQERKLWSALRNRTLDGIKVRRQFPVDRFVLDLFVPSCRLAIEVDGNVHISNVERDEERSAAIRAMNITIIRFTNDEGDSKLPGVLAAIRAAAGSSDTI